MCRDGLQKMAEVYQTDPKACDIDKVEKMLARHSNELNQLTQDKLQLEACNTSTSTLTQHTNTRYM